MIKYLNCAHCNKNDYYDLNDYDNTSTFLKGGGTLKIPKPIIYKIDCKQCGGRFNYEVTSND